MTLAFLRIGLICWDLFNFIYYFFPNILNLLPNRDRAHLLLSYAIDFIILYLNS